MPYYSIPLKAGIAYRHDVAGSLLLIDSVGASGGVDIALIRNGTPAVTMPHRQKAFRYVSEFEGLILKTPVDATIALFISFSDVQLGVQDGLPVQIPGGVTVTNAADTPVQVAFPNGVINLTATNVIVSNEALKTIVHFAPVSVGLAAAYLVSDATLKKLRIRNSHATAVLALGGAGVTLENAAIQLQPGDMWLEDDAAGAAWYAISDTAAVNVQLQGVK